MQRPSCERRRRRLAQRATRSQSLNVRTQLLIVERGEHIHRVFMVVCRQTRGVWLFIGPCVCARSGDLQVHTDLRMHTLCLRLVADNECADDKCARACETELALILRCVLASSKRRSQQQHRTNTKIIKIHSICQFEVTALRLMCARSKKRALCSRAVPQRTNNANRYNERATSETRFCVCVTFVASLVCALMIALMIARARLTGSQESS